MTLSCDEFLRRFLLHLLPKGFVRIPHFGFLANPRRAALLPRCFAALHVIPPKIEARILRKDGQFRWFLIRGKPLRDGDGNIVRWFSSGTDIEDRKRVQWEIEQLVDAVPQHLVVLSGDGRRLYANKTVRDYHGMTLREFLAEEVPSHCFHPDDVALYMRSRTAGIASGQPWEAEARLRRKDGQYRWFLYRASLVGTGGKRNPGAAASLTEISPRTSSDPHCRRLPIFETSTGRTKECPSS